MVNQRTFFDIEIDKKAIGRVVFELYNHDVPRTTENFRCLCTGEKGLSEKTRLPLHFKGSQFHRIIKDFMIQGGDFQNSNGTGGESIYGKKFDDEAFKYRHSEPYLLSMANMGPNTNGSQFFITTAPAPHLDGKHVVFGRVVSGKEVIDILNATRTDQKDKPYAEVSIAHCGELVLKSQLKKPVKPEDESKESESESDSETSSSEEERKRRKKEKKDKKKKRRSKEKRKSKRHSDSDTTDDSDSDDEDNIKKKSKKHKKRGRSPSRSRSRSPGKEKKKHHKKEKSRSRSRSSSVDLLKDRYKPLYKTPVVQQHSGDSKVKGRGSVKYHSHSSNSRDYRDYREIRESRDYRDYRENRDSRDRDYRDTERSHNDFSRDRRDYRDLDFDNKNSNNNTDNNYDLPDRSKKIEQQTKEKKFMTPEEEEAELDRELEEYKKKRDEPIEEENN
ncbi:Cyclophilin [Tieghemostelium lacteum]|uniref:peptidylprolyl isomerase n=1 Tax=Tieghemostelium lacteum TaxID=361077 RepID=A0A151Z9J8_TIELA|nr:Cyclophilin [Tieghemostelium lacteum]|eukprot:KYQ90613.1 Cyclophilin [Tieghemostelium lacteum]